MKLNKLMLGLAFVACAGLVMTSCKKKDKDNYLTVGEAKAAFLAADEAMAALEADLAAEPAIKIIDKMLTKANGYKLTGKNPHIALKYYQDFFFIWKDKNFEGGIGYLLEENGNLKAELDYKGTDENGNPINHDLNQIYFPLVDKDTAWIQYSSLTTDPKLSASAKIFYPDAETPIFSTVTCTVDPADRDNGDMNFTFNSSASGGKHFTISYNSTTSTGVPVPGSTGMTLGAGSYIRWLFVQRNVSETVYSLKDVHGQALLGLLGKDKQELRWGNIKLYIDATTKVTKDTKIEIYNIEDKERLIGNLDAVSGIITYKDGGNTGQATTDMPLLYAHIKEVFNL